jgi:hypothetical protein
MSESELPHAKIGGPVPALPTPGKNGKEKNSSENTV